jgi:hypothetical protein
MIKGNHAPLFLLIKSDKAFLPVAAGFAEDAARSLGLGRREALAMRLAAEEIFLHLCKVATSGNRIEMTCTGGGYFVELAFLFRDRIPLHAFNLTATISLDDDASLDEMGLLLASRSVDRFEIREAARDRIILSLIKEKAYPPAPSEPLPPLDTFKTCAIRPADGEALKIFALRVVGRYPAHLVPGFFSCPGKVVDMVIQGDFRAMLAVDDQGQIAGGILWHRAGTKLIEFFGPYRFGSEPPATLGEDLLEACLMAIGKSDAVGLYCRLPAEPPPAAYFEKLGSLDLWDEGHKHLSIPVFFRQIHEDPGDTVWCHPDLEDFLSRAYRRHFLPRRIESVREMGETAAADSVLSARMDRFQEVVVLKAVQPGKDADRNLADHVKLMIRESFRNLLFELDLGIPWQAHLVPPLHHNGFVPKLVVPYGGEGDLVIFQWDGCKDA